MMLTDLATVLRAAGLKVQEVPGWKTRGHGQMTSVETIACHHTAGPKTGNYPSLGVVRDGRPGLDGPLAQLGLARDGTWLVIAAGVCWHAGVVFESWQNNYHAIGIEAEGTGVDPWPAIQYNSYVAGVRALKDHYKVPLSHVLGHKEIAKPKGRKTDPNFDMNNFRAAVARGNDQEDDDMGLTSDDRAYIEKRVQAYAAFGAKHTDQVLRTATAAIIKAVGGADTDATAAVTALNSELDKRDAATAAELKTISDNLAAHLADD